MSKRLVDYTDLELLAELLRRHPPKPGPNRVSWSHRPLGAVIGVGKDHVADIYLDEDAYEALKDLLSDEGARNSPRWGDRIPHSER